MSEEFFINHPEMDENDALFIKFVVEKIEKGGGSLKFQHITGHLSQLSSKIRQHVGTKQSDLLRVLRKYEDLFSIANNGMVSLRKSSAVSSERILPNSSHSHNHNNNVSQISLPSFIKSEGVVFKVLPSYGFISSKDPKCVVYFTPACFENGQNSYLTDLVQPGQKVCFEARRAAERLESKYQATKVCIPEKVENEVLHPEGFHKKKTGLYDPSTSEGFGKVQKVFDTHGFLIIDDDPQNTVFFHKNVLSNVENVTSLTKVLQPGDIISYNALRSTKKDAKARWVATRIWLKKQVNSKIEKKKECFKLNKSDKKVTREMLKNEAGKIVPHSKGIVIKFGKELEKIADADACIFYVLGEPVKDPCWEFSEGDRVKFDGIQIKSAPGWKALLAWAGERPNIVLPIDIGDYEAVKELDDEMNDDLPESGSITSVSVSSEASQNSSQPSRYPKSNQESSQAFNSSRKRQYSKSRSKSRSSKADREFNVQRNSSVNSRSSRADRDFNARRNSSPSKSHSVSSQRSQSNKQAFKNSEKIVNRSSSVVNRFVSENSEISDIPYCEDDSGFGSEFHPEKRLSPKSFSYRFDGDSCEDVRKGQQYMTKTFTNWGDSPYPDEENYESEPEESSNVFIKENSDFKRVSFPISSNTSSHSKYASLEQNLDVVNSDDDFSDAVQELSINKERGDGISGKKFPVYSPARNDADTVGMMTKDDSPISVFQEVDGEKGSESMVEDTKELQKSAAAENDIGTVLDQTSKEDNSIFEESKPKPYIRKLCNLSGKVFKVYCRYALIEHSDLKRTATFFWTDFYCNGKPAAERYDDLKLVLKAGDMLSFNCIEITDDSGSFWQKVTVAWKGQRPKMRDLSPAEYISENKLVVSVDEDEIEVQDDDSTKSKRLLNIEKPKPVAAPRQKFLTDAFCDDDDDEDTRNPSTSSSEVLASVVNGTEPSYQSRLEVATMSQEQMLPGSVPSLSLKQLIETVKGMLVSYKYSEEDVDVVSSGVVSYVLSRSVAEKAPVSKPSNEQCQEKSSQTETSIHDEEKERNCIRQSSHITNSSSQTIITGEVIAQSIFTQ